MEDEEGRSETGREEEIMDTPIFETWLRHCLALSVYRFYFDAF